MLSKVTLLIMAQSLSISQKWHFQFPFAVDPILVLCTLTKVLFYQLCYVLEGAFNISHFVQSRGIRLDKYCMNTAAWDLVNRFKASLQKGTRRKQKETDHIEIHQVLSRYTEQRVLYKSDSFAFDQVLNTFDLQVQLTTPINHPLNREDPRI